MSAGYLNVNWTSLECTQQNNESVEINLKNHLKVGFFRATVECVLLYGAECWTMTGKIRNRLHGTYTRMLRAVLGVSWKEHKTNKELYGNLPKITDTLMIRRLRFIGHCWKKKKMR